MFLNLPNFSLGSPTSQMYIWVIFIFNPNKSLLDLGILKSGGKNQTASQVKNLIPAILKVGPQFS